MKIIFNQLLIEKITFVLLTESIVENNPKLLTYLAVEVDWYRRKIIIYCLYKGT